LTTDLPTNRLGLLKRVLGPFDGDFLVLGFDLYPDVLATQELVG
jgi:hypothetical protein